MNLSELTPPPDLPVPAARVPALSVRAALAVLGILLTLLVFGTSRWVIVGVIFSLLAAWAPDYMLSWMLIVFLALGQLGRSAGLGWQLLVLIAGVHLLHLLGALALALPWRSWFEPRVLRRPLLRYVAIQIPVQVLAVILLPLLAPNAHGHRPLSATVVTILGGLALAALALLMLWRRSEEGTQ